jgi:serine protease inhibitor
MTDRTEVASALSGNSLLGEKSIDEPHINKTELESKMLVFNGLYYRGKWGVTFKESVSNEKSVFVTSTGKENPVKMMYAEGFFKYGNFDEHNFEAVLLPYEVRIS